ncbi:LrgB family protein [Paenalcaligenes niemegkensis]|uniref:LrgB family protein n=1 Tax=Paenalcaligenes niemegkensis TaxID=2895469 RepID=UPI001EE9306E|nr:LrgB family protein [Paenalcaligenes niemegkensis]MCQ9617507.1 LrgB family protein [Paenalcaligenes niemegkensis]
MNSNDRELFRIWVFLSESPLLWLTITLCVYCAALYVYRAAGSTPFLLPVLTSVVVLVLILLATDTPYPTYFEGAQFIHFLVGPATVALAIPLYSQIKQLRKHWKPILLALFLGTSVAMVSTAIMAWALGGSSEMIISLIPKTATMPIAMALVDHFGGQPSLSAVSVAITGIAGTIMAGPLLHMLGVRNSIARGFSMGLSAHAIGTARSLQIHEKVGAFAALGMGLTGVTTAIMMPIVMAGLRAVNIL